MNKKDINDGLRLVDTVTSDLLDSNLPLNDYDFEPLRKVCKMLGIEDRMNIIDQCIDTNTTCILDTLDHINWVLILSGEKLNNNDENN